MQDQYIPLASLDEMANNDYDVLVVRTGAGGGAAIWRLYEKLRDTDKKIGVVEAGLTPIPPINFPIEIISPAAGITATKTMSAFPNFCQKSKEVNFMCVPLLLFELL